MKRALKYLAILVLTLFGAAFTYGAIGYVQATRHADGLVGRAALLQVQGHGPQALGVGRAQVLLMVQDPAFASHAGIDLTTAGAGITTLSQSLAKRLAFENFTPGIGKIRQTGYAMGLESKLSKDEIFTLWLDTVEMGRGPNGWMTGFYTASDLIYQMPPVDLTEANYIRLLSVLIAPAKYDLRQDDTALDERARRITRLIAQECTPVGNSDVWLEGCA